MTRQSKIADFSPHYSSPQQNSVTNMTSYMHVPHYVKYDVIHRTGSTQHIALSLEEDRASIVVTSRFHIIGQDQRRRVCSVQFARWWRQSDDRNAVWSKSPGGVTGGEVCALRLHLILCSNGIQHLSKNVQLSAVPSTNNLNLIAFGEICIHFS